MTLEIGTKIRILTDDYVAAGSDFDPKSTDPEQGVIHFAAGTEAIIAESNAHFEETVMNDPFKDVFGEPVPAFVEGMLEADRLLIYPADEGTGWERV